MIRRKAIRKIFITTLSLFVILIICTITNINKDNNIKVSVELEDVTSLTNGSVYLLNNNNYLVKKNIFIDSTNMEDRIRKVINYLKINDNSKYSSNLIGVIPGTCVLNYIIYDEEYITLDFSKSFLDIKDMDIAVTSIVYSLFDLTKVKGVSILVEDSYLSGYPKIIDKNLDINKEILLTSREEINKVVIYYLMDDNESYYYVPVTKYLNDSREKINIIVDEMVSNTSYDLVSLVNSNLELLESREDNDVMILNFNNYLFDNNNEVLEEVLYCLSYSVFDNYDVEMVMIEVNGKNIYSIDRKSL